MTHGLGLRTAAALMLLLPSQALAQRTLGAPTATLDHEFTGIDGLRELRDGRIVVLDASDRSIFVINLATKALTRIGREGDGPGEFRLPIALYPIGGDSTLVYDMGRYGRMLVVTPAGEIGGLIPTVDNAFGNRVFMVGATDAASRLYENSYAGDSNSIVRWDRARGRRDTLARISMYTVSPLFRPRPAAAQGEAESSAGPPPPFATVSQWAVAADGRVAIVTPEPYRVTLVSPSGARVQSPSIPVVAVPVGPREKAAYRLERQQPIPTLTIGAGGSQVTTFRVPPFQEPAEWPAKLPAFLPKAVTFASDGTLWVRRTTPAGAAPLYDVFDAKATRAFQVVLPAETRLVGFGAGSVYLARVDEDGLHYLQRYRLPK